MKIVGLMILVPLVALFVLVGIRRIEMNSPGTRGNSSISSAERAAARRADKVAFEKIRAEHASGRFPFLVASLCRDFLDRFPDSEHRAEVELMLRQSRRASDSNRR